MLCVIFNAAIPGKVSVFSRYFYCLSHLDIAEQVESCSPLLHMPTSCHTFVKKDPNLNPFNLKEPPLTYETRSGSSELPIQTQQLTGRATPSQCPAAPGTGNSTHRQVPATFKR